MSKLRSLNSNEHELIGDIIGHSFADDPVNQWVFKNQTGITNFFTLVAKKLYLPRGFGHVLENGSGGSMWLPQHVKKHIPLWNSIDIATSMIRHGGLKSVFQGMQVDDYLANKKPSKSHYYLFAIGTRPEDQGKGIGTKIMEAGLRQVDSAGMPAFLESSKESNIPFYEKFGFKVIEKIIPAKGCPPLWLMWRGKSVV